MADELTNEQVLSLLNKMDVEENTLRPLWDQFTVARRQARNVVNRYMEINTALPDLERRKEELEASITFLVEDHRERKETLRLEMDRYRASLESEIKPLEQSVKEGREKVIAVQGSVQDAERRHNQRLQDIEERTVSAKDRLAAAEEALAEIARKVAR